VLVAAGIAFYENEHIREFILNYRRKLAIALHSLGDEINPSSQSRNTTDDDPEAAAEARRRRREEIVRLNRLEMIRQAREEGIAVDLDELVKLGEAEAGAEESKATAQPSTADRSRSFDALVGADGTLRQPEMSQASGVDNGPSTMRHRGVGARGFGPEAASANPFDDEAQVLFDREMIGSSVHSDVPRSSRETTRTLSPVSAEPMDTESQYFSEDEMDAQIEEAIRRSMQDQTVNKNPANQEPEEADPPISVPQSTESSYYYAPPPNVHQPPASAQSLYSSAMEAMMQANLHQPLADDADDECATPSGTLTPMEGGQSTAASLVGSQAEDVGRLSDFHSMADDDEMDARSEATSEAFSMLGASTPGSWTDVESEVDDEDDQHMTQPTHTVLTQ
jgi:hypothetical protein